MISINPYLNFMGNTEDVMNFYKSVFGGDFAMFQRFKDTPGHENMPADEHDKVMHVSLPMGKRNTLMASDALKSMGHSINAGNNFWLAANTENKEEADRVFQKLSDGGKVAMPMNDTFWGAYFGMCTDKYGIQWMISYDPNIPA